ncbi:hypothetical protein QJQ45_025817, partial [Haematococcus lacustris]
ELIPQPVMHFVEECSSGEELDVKGEPLSGAGPLSRKGAPWSVEEHCAFLKGLEKLGNWRGISRYFVQSRTPTQVASHAQKHFLRIGSGASRRRSRFAAIEEEVLASPTKQQQQPPLSPPLPLRHQHSTYHLHHPINGGVSRSSHNNRLATVKHPHHQAAGKPPGHGAQAGTAQQVSVSPPPRPLQLPDPMQQLASSGLTPLQPGPSQPAAPLCASSQPASSTSSGSEGATLPPPGPQQLPLPILPATGVPCFMPHLLFSFPQAGLPPGCSLPPFMYSGPGVPPLTLIGGQAGACGAVLGVPAMQLPQIMQSGPVGTEPSPAQPCLLLQPELQHRLQPEMNVVGCMQTLKPQQCTGEQQQVQQQVQQQQQQQQQQVYQSYHSYLGGLLQQQQQQQLFEQHHSLQMLWKQQQEQGQGQGLVNQEGLQQQQQQQQQLQQQDQEEQDQEEQQQQLRVSRWQLESSPSDLLSNGGGEGASGQQDRLGGGGSQGEQGDPPPSGAGVQTQLAAMDSDAQCCARNGAPLHPQLLALAIAAGLCEMNTKDAERSTRRVVRD